MRAKSKQTWPMGEQFAVKLSRQVAAQIMRIYRLKLKLSINKLSEITKIPTRVLSLLEKGEICFDNKRFQKLRKAFGPTFDYQLVQNMFFMALRNTKNEDLRKGIIYCSIEQVEENEIHVQIND